jgi:hypothetical protein
MANITKINNNLINADTASFATTASYALTGGSSGNPFPYSGSAVITGSLRVTGSVAITGSINATSVTSSFTGSLTGALIGTASWATSAVTASVILNQRSTTNAPFYLTAVDSFNSPLTEERLYGVNIIINPSNSSITASGGISASLEGTASWANNATNALTASYSTKLGERLQTSSLGGLALLSSDATVLTQINTLTASLALRASGSLTGSLFGTASWAESASQAISASRAITSSFALTASLLLGSITSASFASTSSFLNPGTYLVTSSWAQSASQAISSSRAITSSNALTASYSDTLGATIVQLSVGSIQLRNSLGTSISSISNFAALSSSNALTASFVNTLNQNIIITGSAVIGSSSLGPSENTLTLGARDSVNEGGQLGFSAPGGTYTSASMIDLYQDRLRVLKGTNAGSVGEAAWWSMNNLQMALPAYTGSGAFPGTEVAMLGVDTSGNILTTSLLGSTIFGNYAGTGFTNPVVTYLPFGTTTVSGTETQRQIASPFAGLLKNIYIRTNGAAVATSFTTFIVRVNGVATNIQINISGGQAAGLYSNTINSASVALGAEISLQVSTSVANGPQVNQYSFGIYPS